MNLQAICHLTDINKTKNGFALLTGYRDKTIINLDLHDLPPGEHGFHIHEFPNCSDKGMSAGGHMDPTKSNSHQGPYGAGHLGDLPLLAVDESGKATTPLLAPRLKTSDLGGHAIMIHAGGDNYSDTPPLGGGGARIGCGVIGEPN